MQDRLVENASATIIKRSVLTSIDPSLINNLEKMTNEEALQIAFKILRKPHSFRDHNDEEYLHKVLPNNDFFEKLQEDRGVDILFKCYKSLSYEFHRAGEPVFRINDLGDKFYIILRGKVSVQIYSKEKPTEKKDGKAQRIMIEVNELHAGDKFGELALIDNKPRKATIICKDDCDFATLDRESYKELLEEADRIRMEQKITNIISFPIFGEWARPAFQTLNYNFDEQQVLLNKVLFKEGEEPIEIFFIMEGEFKVIKNLEMPRNDNNYSADPTMETYLKKASTKRKVELTYVTKGDILGIEDVIFDRKRTITAICTSAPGRLYRVQAADFKKKIITAFPEFFNRLVKEFCDNKDKRNIKRVKALMAQVEMNKNLMFDTSSIMKYEKRIEAIPPHESDTPVNQSAELPPVRRRSPPQQREEKKKDDSNFFLTDVLNIQNDESDLLKTNTSMRKPPRGPLTTKHDSDHSFSFYGKKTEFSASKNNLSHDRSFESEYILTSGTESKDRIYRAATSTKRKALSVVNEAPLRNPVEVARREVRNLLQTGIFEMNVNSQPGSRNNNRSPKHEDQAQNSSKYITSRPIEVTYKSPLESETLFNRKEQIFEELDKKCKTKVLNIQEHLAQIIHDDHVLRRRTPLPTDEREKRKIANSEDKHDVQQQQPQRDPNDSYMNFRENERQVARSVFYRGRKHLRALAENAKMKSKNKSYWDLSMGDIGGEQESVTGPAILQQSAQEILKPLPISNKQLRNKFMKAKMKHYQVFGSQF